MDMTKHRRLANMSAFDFQIFRMFFWLDVDFGP